MVPGVKMRPTELQVQKDGAMTRIKYNLVQLQLPYKAQRVRGRDEKASCCYSYKIQVL